MEKHPIVITTTLHEPLFRLRNQIDTALPLIQEYIKNLIIICTRTTHKDVIAYLEEKSFKVQILEDDNRVNTYSEAIRQAVVEIREQKSQRIMYIDFDRLIHWINKYPEEFKKTLSEALKTDLLHLGRSSRAFKTHPETQTNTEQIINYLGSQALMLSKTIDLISVCFSFTPTLADLILNKTYSTEMGFYIAWPVILWDHALNKKYKEVEGLEWETPDRFTSEINKLGYEKWLKQFQSPREWKNRVKLLDECVIELNNLMNS